MYIFALKIIFAILNKSTQYISFIAITLFLTFFLITKQGLVIYEDEFINSLKGLYPEFITNSVSMVKKYKDSKDVEVVKEIFVYSEEIQFSYGDDLDVSKFMNVRTYDKAHREELFSTLTLDGTCDVKEDTLWISNRLYQNMLQDSSFDKKHLYFVNNDDEYQQFSICTFELTNNEKWLVTSTKNASQMAYMPLASNALYVKDKKLKKKLYKESKINSWKEYIDYDDLGIFLLAKHVSTSFLVAFFIFLISFMIIAFSSLAKEFEASIFLQKIFGMNKQNTIFLYILFFIIYIFFLGATVILEYNIITFLIYKILSITIILDILNLALISLLLLITGIFVSTFITLKYHRLPL